MTDRLPPQDLEAERAVLGSMMLSPDAVDDVLQHLAPEHFYLEKHARVFGAIRDMSLKHQGIGTLTLGKELERRRELEMAGGSGYLVELLESVGHAHHAEFYAKIVRNAADRRFVIEQAAAMLKAAYDAGLETEAALAQAEQAVTRMVERSAKTHDATDLQTILVDAVAKLESGATLGQPIGFSKLDAMTTGIHPGQLIVIGARPGHGKTAFGVNIAHQIGANVPIAFFSLEMSSLELAERMLSLECSLGVSTMRGTALNAHQRLQMADGANMLYDRKIFIMDDADISTMRISAVSRLLKRKRDIGLIIVDYLQLITHEDRRLPRQEQVSDMSRSLKKLAKSLQIPVIVMAQLNRNIENRADKRPRLADLRESGAIEQDADQVWLLYCPFKDADPGSKDADKNDAQVHVAKNRSGPSGAVAFEIVKELMKFRELEVNGRFSPEYVTRIDESF